MINHNINNFLKRDVNDVADKSIVQSLTKKVYEGFGYRKVETPYIDQIGKTILVDRENLFKILDKNGEVLSVSSDHLSSIVSDLLNANAMCMSRLFYFGKDYALNSFANAKREKEVIGATISCVNGIESEVEQVVMATELCKKINFANYKIVINHAELLRQIALSYNINEITQKEVFAISRGENPNNKFPEDLFNILYNILQIKGGIGVVNKVSDMVTTKGAVDCLLNIFELLQVLIELGLEDNIIVDFTYLGEAKYYNGIVFKIRNEEDNSSIIYGGKIVLGVNGGYFVTSNQELCYEEFLRLYKLYKSEDFATSITDIVIACTDTIASIVRANDLRKKFVTEKIRTYLLYSTSKENTVTYCKLNNLTNCVYIDDNAEILTLEGIK